MKAHIKYLSMIPCILIMVVIFYFSSRPAELSTGDSMTITKIIYQVYENIVGSVSVEDKTEVMNSIDHIVRKTAHAFIYCMLSISYCLPIYVRYDKKHQTSNLRRLYLTYIPAVGMAFLYACSDEFHQRFVMGRSCEFRDVIIDTLGATVGVLVFCITLTLLYSRKKKELYRN